jgi:hypothetical protein
MFLPDAPAISPHGRAPERRAQGTDAWPAHGKRTLSDDAFVIFSHLSSPSSVIIYDVYTLWTAFHVDDFSPIPQTPCLYIFNDGHPRCTHFRLSHVNLRSVYLSFSL